MWREGHGGKLKNDISPVETLRKSKLERGNFQGSPVIRSKFSELVKKEEEKQAILQKVKILPTSSKM